MKTNYPIKPIFTRTSAISYTKAYIIHLVAFIGILTASSLSLCANAQALKMISFKQLTAYEGVYEYFTHSTLKIAASPKDTILYAIINKSSYPLRWEAADIFTAASNDTVKFIRNSRGKITGYTTDKHIFNLISRNVHFSAAMWYPRMVANPKNFVYHYVHPPQLSDGLATAGLNASGLDHELLAAMVQKIVAGQYPNVHSILILRNNKLVFEEYFYEYNRDSLQEMRSASKSVVSALMGIAIHQGKIKSVKDGLLALLPEYHFANPSPLKEQITIQDLLDNQSGVNYDEAWDKSIGNETDMNSSNDWVKYTFDLPMIDTPGIKGRYNSGNPITAGWLIEKYSHMSLYDFASRYLFGPMGITDFKWDFRPDPSNVANFCQVLLTPRDMAKFGLLYLDNGVWQGRQLIPVDWVAESTTKHSVVQGVNYGYLWWLKYMDADNVRYYSFAAQGNGGQKIYVFRDLDLVVVTTGGNYNTQSPADELIKTYILPAFNNR